MSNSQAIYCLSSDDDDDDEDALLNGSFLTRRQHQQPAAVVSSNETSRTSKDASSLHANNQDFKQNDESSLLEKVMQASRATLAVDEERRRRRQSMESSVASSLWSPLAPPLGFYESEDDDALEVLPAQKTSLSIKSTGPRLSFSGQDVNDPIDLLHDDSGTSPQQSTISSRLAQQYGKLENDSSPMDNTKFSSKPVAAAAMDDDDLSSSSSSPEPNKTIPPNAPPALAAVRRRATSPLLSSSDDDDDSDDSFAKKCRDFQARRKRARPPDTTTNATAQEQLSTKPAAAKKKTKENNVNDAAATSSKLSAAQRQAQKQAAKEQKEREQQAAREQKKRDKELAKESREREKLAKQQAQQVAKAQRQEARQQSNQERGKFANQEIAVLLEPTLLEDANTQNLYKIQKTLEASGFTILQPYPAGLSCQAIQFIRQEYLQGGATQAVQDLMLKGPPQPGQAAAYEHIPILSVVVEGHAFIRFLIKQDENDDVGDTPRGSSDDDDYPLLEQWLFGLVVGWRAAWHKTAADRPRIILLLYKVQESLDSLWVQYNRNKRRGPTPPNTEQMHDAILWMLIQFQVDSIHCVKPEDVAHEIFKMTRFLAESPYAKQATDLQTIAKLPAHVSDMAPSLDRARDTWIRQLQQIPRISADMAYNISKHYPTALSLWNVYQDESIPVSEKQLLLANLFGTRAVQNKLSLHVYRALTSDDPGEILS